MRGKKTKIFLAGFGACVVLIAIGYSVYFMSSIYMNVSGEALTRETLGQMGDYFGGILNPLLSFLTVILLIATAYLSKNQAKDTREQLRLSKDEYNRKQLEDALLKLYSAQIKLREYQFTTPIALKNQWGRNLQELRGIYQANCVDEFKNFVEWSQVTNASHELSDTLAGLRLNLLQIYKITVDVMSLTHLNSLKQYWYTLAYEDLERCKSIGLVDASLQERLTEHMMRFYDVNQ